MIISELKLYDFRKFHGNPGLSVTFHKGLNAIIGENDSGKTAIIDALKLVLLTQSNEYIRPTDNDFYQSPDGETVSEFRIECTISDFLPNEAKNFIEYLSFEKEEKSVKYFLHLHYRAWKEGNRRIFQELKVGDSDDSISMDGKARELLRAVYLKPLRDAEREMSAGRSSRLSQILLSHPAFKNKKEHELTGIFRDANNRIEKYFTENAEGKVILHSIRDNLASFNEKDQPSDAELKTADIQLKSILESLSLNAPEIQPGLGELNLLYIAAELLLLKDDTDGGLKLAMIEELEAHLHPQAQLRLISYLQNEYSENDVQIIISTHSSILASKINLKNLILIKNSCGYDLAEGKTALVKGDYLFLQRFLDATKSNLFFAKGIIMVEGDAENILLPIIANILGYPLEKNGVSVVNVGSTAFLRYSRIMVRADESTIGIPVSIVTDCDVKPYDVDQNTKEKVFREKPEESQAAVQDKIGKYQVGAVHAYVSPRWTLEYCIAMSCLSEDFHRAIHFGKKILNAREYISLTDKKIEEAIDEVGTEAEAWKDLSTEEKAYNIYNLMLNSEGKSGLKAIVAQCLSSIMRWNTSVIPDGISQEKMFDLELHRFKTDDDKRAALKRSIEEDPYLRYIVDAIKYAAGEEV